MRVLHYRRSFSELSETFIYDSILELERQGVENYVLTHRHVNESGRPFDKVVTVEEPVRWNPLRLLRGVMTSEKKRKMGVHLWPQIRKEIENELRKIKPDVIHAHFGPEGVIVETVADKLGIPLVTSFYGYDISRLIRQNFWVERYQCLMRENSLVTALSEHMKSKLIELGFWSERVKIIHISRDLTGFEFQKANLPIQNFVSVGRLSGKKGHFDTINAIDRVLRSGNNVTLKIIGDGELRGELEKYIKVKGLEKSVHLLGKLSADEVSDHMHEADSFILCSKTASDGDMEGTPTVLVEAQAIGLPCISTFHAGIPEMIPKKNHILLSREGDVGEIANKIKNLIAFSSDTLERLIERGRQKIEKEFNLEREVTKLIYFYKEVVRNYSSNNFSLTIDES